MLEEPEVIDMVLQEAGSPVLIVTDAGITPSPAERRRLLERKLQNYAAALARGELAEFGDPRTAEVRVMCAQPPGEFYQDVTSIRVTMADGTSFDVPVRFRHLPNPYA